MKRVWTTGIATLVFLLWAVPVALAQYPPDGEDRDPGAGLGGGGAGGAGGANGAGGGLAGTGARITVGMVILLSLVVLGTILLVASRRRKTQAAE